MCVHPNFSKKHLFLNVITKDYPLISQITWLGTGLSALVIFPEQGRAGKPQGSERARDLRAKVCQGFSANRHSYGLGTFGESHLLPSWARFTPLRLTLF